MSLSLCGTTTVLNSCRLIYFQVSDVTLGVGEPTFYFPDLLSPENELRQSPDKLYAHL